MKNSYSQNSSLADDLAALVEAHAEECTRQKGEYSISELVKQTRGKMTRYQMIEFCEAMYRAGQATKRYISKIRYYKLTGPMPGERRAR